MWEFIHQNVPMVALEPRDAANLLETLAQAKQAAADLCRDEAVAGAGSLIASIWETSVQRGGAFEIPAPYKAEGAIVLPTAVYNGVVMYFEAIQAARDGSCTENTAEQAHNAALMAAGAEIQENEVTAPVPHPWTKIGIAASVLGTGLTLWALLRKS